MKKASKHSEKKKVSEIPGNIKSYYKQRRKSGKNILKGQGNYKKPNSVERTLCNFVTQSSFNRVKSLCSFSGKRVWDIPKLDKRGLLETWPTEQENG